MLTLRDLRIHGHAALVLAALGTGGCEGTHVDHIEMVFDAEGDLHVMAHLRAIEGEGYLGRSLGFRYARRAPEGWDHQRLELPPMAYGEEGFYELERWASGDVALIANVVPTATDVPWDASPTVLEHSATGEWTPVPMSDSVAEVFDGFGVAGASWVDARGELVLAVDSVIVESRSGELAVAHETSFAPYRCHFDQYGDANLAGCFGGFFTLTELICDDSACRWEDRPDHGLGPTGPVVEGTFLHSGAGVPTIVHDLMNDARLRVAAGGEERFVGDDVYHFGVARRPSGGIVIVTHHYYTEAVALQLVPEAYDAPIGRVDLGTIEIRGSLRLPIVVTEDDHAHVVVATSSSSFSYFDVDLAGGSRREDFDI